MEGTEESYDNGLKLFLDRDEMERLYDFEEDCVEGYFAEQENKLQQSTEERIKVTTERIEHLTQKVEDIHTKENMQTTVLQNLEVRCRKFTEQLTEITNDFENLRKVVRQQSVNLITPQATLVAQDSRERSVSDKSEILSEDDSFGQLLAATHPVKRKPIVRSLTEVRPDAYIFDNGQHIEYRVSEDDDHNRENREHLDNISAAGSRSKLNLLRQRTKSTDSKTSIESDRNSFDISADDIAALSLDILRSRAAQKRRDSESVRRGSESGTGDDTSSSTSKATLGRRQFSQTQSEPETIDIPASASGTIAGDRNVTFTEPRIKVIPPSSRGGLLMHMHSEYASITDELETVCGLLSPPRSPGLLSSPRPEQSPPSHRKRNPSEMSNPEIAINFEKEHLRSAEECDYMVMENLIQRRYEHELEDDTDEGETEDLGEGGSGPGVKNPALLTVLAETREYRVNSWPARQQTLKRSQAVDGDATTTPGIGSSGSSSTDRQDSTDSKSSGTSGGHPTLKRPSIVIDSSHLPTVVREEVKKADSKSSLHMQSETMC